MRAPVGVILPVLASTAKVTIEDPKTYTKPFTIKFAFNLLPDTDIQEWVCSENERDRAHVTN